MADMTCGECELNLCPECGAEHDSECGQVKALMEARAEVEAWKETAAQHLENQMYYSGLIDDVAQHLGPDVFICGDGSKSTQPLRAKVPELAGRLQSEADRLRRERDDLLSRLNRYRDGIGQFLDPVREKRENGEPAYSDKCEVGRLITRAEAAEAERDRLREELSRKNANEKRYCRQCLYYKRKNIGGHKTYGSCYLLAERPAPTHANQSGCDEFLVYPEARAALKGDGDA